MLTTIIAFAMLAGSEGLPAVPDSRHAPDPDRVAARPGDLQI